MPYVSKAFNPIVTNPINSADVEANAIVRAHQTAGTKPMKARTTSNGAAGGRLAGRKVSGGSTVRGGKG